MKSLLPILFFLLFFDSKLFSQNFQFGGELGPNLSGAIVKDPGADPSGKPSVGFQLGGFANYELASKVLSLSARLLYSYEGYAPDIYDTKAKVRVSFLKIPINAVYKAGQKIFVGLGPYFAFGIGGHYTSDNTNGKIKINFGNNADNDDLKRVDIGADIMGGYQLNENIFIRAAFDIGVINYLTPGSTADASAHCLSFGVTAGYILGKK